MFFHSVEIENPMLANRVLTPGGRQSVTPAPTMSSRAEQLYVKHRRLSLSGVAMACTIVIPFSIVAGTSAWAENINWVGTGSWFNSNNWRNDPEDEPVVPTIVDTAYIYRPGPVIDTADAETRDIVVAGPNGSFTVTAGRTLITTGNPRIGDGPNTFGTAKIIGAGAAWNVDGNAEIGTNGGAGAVEVSNGGKVSTDQVWLGDKASAVESSITVTGKGSAWTTGLMRLGSDDGTRGKLIVADGGIFTAKDIFALGDKDGGVAQIFVGGNSANPTDAKAPGTINAATIILPSLADNISNRSINFNHTDNSRTYQFTPGLQGYGVLNFYNGATVLTGDSSKFMGPTNVREKATLIVKGSLAGSVVDVWGVLGGSDKVKDVNIHGGGTASPGNSIGTLHILGNLNMAPDSKYHVELNGTTSDRIEVGGTANIQSAIFEIAHDTNTKSAPVVPGKTYTLLTTGGGLTVTSPTVAIADFPFLAFTLSADVFNGYLTTSRSAISFADLAATPNEKAVAGALDTMAASNPLWQQVVGASDAQARASFTSLGSASIHANAAGALSEQSQYLRDAVTGRLRQDFAYGTPLAQPGNVLSYADGSPRNAYASMPFHKATPLAAAPSPAQVYSVWAQALGSQGSLKGDGNAAQTNHSLGGVISGIDVTFNGIWRVGLAGGYSQSSFKSPTLAASGTSESYHVAVYGGGQLGAWGLRGGASFSWNDVVTSRQVAVVNLANIQRGGDALKTTQVFGEVGHAFTFNGVALEPFANVAYVLVDGGINEFGLAAVSGSTKLDTTYTTLGVRGATALTQTLTARGMLGWRHALGDVTPVAALAFQSGGAAFALAGSPIARDALVAEAGLDLALNTNASLGITWSGQFAERSYNNAIKGSFSWRF